MKFAIQVDASPYHAQAGASAYQFIKAALQQGHEILRVFFYHDGVYHGFGSCHPPQDEPQPVALWSQLALDHGIDLVLCVSAAQRRGLLTPEQGAQLAAAMPPLAPGFRIAGLGMWVEACLRADRFLVFGG